MATWTLERSGRYIRPSVTGTSPVNGTISISPSLLNITAQQPWTAATAGTFMSVHTTSGVGMSPPSTRELCYDGKKIRIYRWDRQWSSDTRWFYRWPVLKLLLCGLLSQSGKAIAVMIGLQNSSRDSWYELLIDEDFVSEEEEKEEDRA